MDALELIKTRLTASVPFAALVGVEILSVERGRATARLDQRDAVSNHIGTMHAGALFTLGETASGAAMSGAFADRLMRIRPVATAARIGYLRSARGVLHATAQCVETPDMLIETLERDGRVAFDIEVAIHDERDAAVASLTVGWQVRAA